MSRRAFPPIPPSSGAIVMGTGIVSGALALDGRGTLSRILLGIGAVVWILLGVVVASRLMSDRPRLRHEARSPAALTAVAGTEVLGTRLTFLDWHWLGAFMLVIALAIWLVLIRPVLRHRVFPAVGGTLMLTVATESLAVLSAALADRTATAWLLYLALVPFAVGLCLYVWVVANFDWRQLLLGRGDHWITGGALAISTLAAARIALAAKALGVLSGVEGGLEVVALCLCVLALAWLPVLIACEVLRPRLRYNQARWSTVFPVGMYAAGSFVASTAVGWTALRDFARVWVWVALAVWLLVAAGLLRRGAALALSPACSSQR